MNIFYLDRNPQQAAQFHNNKHVVKMILESIQLLSTAHRLLDGKLHVVQNKKFYLLESKRMCRVEAVITALQGEVDFKPYIINPLCYRQTHVNHPSAVWVRESKEHYNWLFNLTWALHDEFNVRYPSDDGSTKIHKAFKLTAEFLSHPPENLSSKGFADPPQAMPDCYRGLDAVQAYRSYYRGEKQDLAKWKNRQVPYWW